MRGKHLLWFTRACKNTRPPLLTHPCWPILAGSWPSVLTNANVCRFLNLLSADDEHYVKKCAHPTDDENSIMTWSVRVQCTAQPVTLPCVTASTPVARRHSHVHRERSSAVCCLKNRLRDCVVWLASVENFMTISWEASDVCFHWEKPARKFSVDVVMRSLT